MKYFGYDPRTDPSRLKASYQAGGVPNYVSAVGAYNKWLYTPLDRQPNSPVTPAASPGWHGASSSVPAGQYSIPQYSGTASVSYKPQPPAMGGTPAQYDGIISQLSQAGLNPGIFSPPAGSAAPSEPTSVSGPPAPTSTGTTTKLTPTVQSTPSMGAPSVPQNAMQRWQSQADGIKPLSDERRFFWATGGNKGGLIDARAPMADPSQNKGAPQPVTFNNSPSGWEPYQ